MLLERLCAAALLAAALNACGQEAKTPEAAAPESPSVESGRPGDMALGSVDAPVTVIEYASVTCPACAYFHNEIFPEIKEKYIDTGKVRFVFRELPTPPANLSIAGSMLARCAAETNGAESYFAVTASLFKSQANWVRAEKPRMELLKIAAQAGMDETAFDSCIKRQDLLDVINAHAASGPENYQINATPGFVINERVRQLRSLDEFPGALDEALDDVGS